MVKKVKLDFSKTEERSGWNTRQMPEGLHRAKVVSVQQTEAQDGTDMLVYGFVPEESKYKSRRFPYYCKLQQNQLWKLRDLLVAAGESVPKKALQIDPEKIVGKTVAIEVADELYNGQTRSTVNGVYDTSILDGDSDSSSDEDEDEEDYEEDEESEDFEEEDDEVEDFDDEDLDDFDEDDFDDEDEEEEPAPKKAPAKKSPAKKPATATRTVRRK